MRRLQWGALVASCGVIVACGLTPLAAPVADPAATTAPTTRVAPPRPMFTAPPRFDLMGVPPMEMENAIEFLQQYSPKRAAMLETLMRQGGRYGLGRQVYLRYRELMVLKEQDPKLYEIKVQLLRVEDELFGDAMAARAARQEGKPISQDIHQRLEKAGLEFVELRIAERKHLIAKLQASLAEDEKDRSAAAQRRIARELNGGPRAGEFAPEGLNRTDGGVPATGP